MNGSFLRRLREWFLPDTPTTGGSARPAASSGGLPDGMRIYAIGDIHGESSLLDRLAGRIERDLAQRPAQTVEAVFLGDYIDRGPDSAGVIERLASSDFPVRFTTLRGNHEDLMLGALASPDAMAPWCQTGGLETLLSYGLDIEKARRGKGLAKAREALIEILPVAHRAVLDDTRLSLTRGGYFFVHAGARPGVPLDRQDEQDLLWIRDECYASAYAFERVLVHGHTPHKAPENLAGRINVDTGAFKWGMLTAVVLEGETRRFLSTGD